MQTYITSSHNKLLKHVLCLRSGFIWKIKPWYENITINIACKCIIWPVTLIARTIQKWDIIYILVTTDSFYLRKNECITLHQSYVFRSNIWSTSKYSERWLSKFWFIIFHEMGRIIFLIEQILGWNFFLPWLGLP